MPSENRRTFLKGVAGALGIAGLGSVPVGGHPAGGSHEIHRHDATKNAELVGYHSLGGFGLESTGGRPENAAPGAISEVWVAGDHVFASYLSSAENRGVAILDASDYLRADSREEVEEAEMSLIATIGNETEAGTAADVKTTEDGEYLIYSKQAIGATYGKAAGTSTQRQDAPGAEPLGIAVYDISDPGEPEYLGTAQGPNAGFHNCFIHRIDGTPYIFGVQGVVAGDAGVHIYRLDEASGAVVPVNFWGGGDLPVTGYGTDTTFYCHDIYVHHDPKTDTPVGYIAYWNNGVRVIDLSDPTDITELGVGKMPRAHYAQPAPALIDGKRVFIGGQEYSSRSRQGAGFVRLFDGDALFEEGTTECPALDTWELYEDVSYEGYAFSPHNADITEDGWVTQAHYHAGVRFLKIQPPADQDEEARPSGLPPEVSAAETASGPSGEWRLRGKEIDRVDVDDRDRTETDEAHEFTGRSGVDVFGNAGNYRHHEFTSPFDETTLVKASLEWTPASAELDIYVERKPVVDDGHDHEHGGDWEQIAAQQSPSGFKQVQFPVAPADEYRYRYVVETDHGPANYTLTGTYFELGPLPAEEEPDVETEALAYYRDHVEVPSETKTEGEMAPNFWSARIENGVTFAGDTNTGLYAIAADPIEVGSESDDD